MGLHFMIEIFRPKQLAARVLRHRVDSAYDRIRQRGDKVTSDNSFVMATGILGDPNGWQPRLLIWSEQLASDIRKLPTLMH